MFYFITLNRIRTNIPLSFTLCSRVRIKREKKRTEEKVLKKIFKNVFPSFRREDKKLSEKITLTYIFKKNLSMSYFSKFPLIF